MAILNQKRILNLIPKTSAPVTIHVSQGDVGTEIEFTLVKGDELFVNTGNLSASVHGVREDGANFGVFTCTLSGSSVKFPLHTEMTAVKGSAIAEIVLVDSQGNKVGSSNFGIMVEESVFPLGVTYDNDVSVYESILAYVQSIPAQISDDYNTKIISINNALEEEVIARSTSDSLLNTRIDEIIAPSGEAPNPSEVVDARIGYDTTVYDTLGDAIRTQITDLKDALNNNIDAFFVDVSNKNFGKGTIRGVDYEIHGNTAILNGTATAGCRIKVSGSAVKTTSSLDPDWQAERIGLKYGHEYLLAIQYLSGASSDRTTLTIYGSLTTSGLLDAFLVPNECKEGEIYYSSNSIIASDENSSCLCIYMSSGRTYSNVKFRFGFVDITAAKEFITKKIKLKDTYINDMNSNIYNRNASFGIQDIIKNPYEGSYQNLAIKIAGNLVTLNGSTTSSCRIKITNDIEVANLYQDSWFEEDLPILDNSHNYLLTATVFSEESETPSNENSIRIYVIPKDRSDGEWIPCDIVYGEPLTMGAKYSTQKIVDPTLYSGIVISCVGAISVSNLQFQINLIDLNDTKTVYNEAFGELKPYYYDDNYIHDRIRTIIDKRSSLSINNAEFLWFTDPHYVYPNHSVQNGMQSAEIAKFINNNTNNSLIICGGDLVRGTLTKSVCKDALIKVREYMSVIYDKTFMCLGNHEYNNPANTSAQAPQELDSSELYSMLIKDKEMIIDSISEKGDYSFTNKIQKIKFFVIGCDNAAKLFTESVVWLANELLTVQAGYHVILISHIGLSNTVISGNEYSLSTEFSKIADLIDAVNLKSTYTYSSHTYDYSNVDYDIICALTGHMHFDGYGQTVNGTPVIATTCDRAFTGSDGDEGAREIRKIGTIGEQALDYVIIDFDNKTIDLVRFGGSILGASYDSETEKVYDTEIGTGTEYTGDEWVKYSPYKDRHFTY